MVWRGYDFDTAGSRWQRTIAFNLERAAMLGIELPTEELIIADVVFQTIGSSRY
jgi:hypothetical protein